MAIPLNSCPPPPRRLFALIIGINEYKSTTISSLGGAVADALAFKAYLQDRLAVPRDRISVLVNQAASRAAIIKGLQRLANNSRIQHGDPILIYYAGHGSEADAPPGWESGSSNAKIQLILPSDVFSKSEGKVVMPIPDRTFGALMEHIAEKKGNNITIIFDTCYSTSGTRSIHDIHGSSDRVRSAPLPSGFRFSANTDGGTWFPTNRALQSHILLAACGPSGLAYESNGRGDFTSALLRLFRDTDISKLRYCDIPMRARVNSRQSPHCEGFNRERLILTLTLCPPAEIFIPIFTRKTNNGLNAYILNGGAAHGLAVGDEFAIYPHMDYPESNGTLVLEELGPFYSIMRPLGRNIPLTGNSVALRVKVGKRLVLRVYCDPGDKTSELLSRLQDNDQDLSHINIVNDPEDAQVHISGKQDQVILQFWNFGPSGLGFHIESTGDELVKTLKASSQFISRLDQTADFPLITGRVEIVTNELETSQSRPLGAPTTQLLPLTGHPRQNDSFTLQQGVPCGVKLINNSPYDLYPVMHYFDTSKFKFETFYEPPCSRSMLDVPLKKDGGSLTIGHGYGGHPPLVIPQLDSEGIGFLKISLFTRPLDPLYDADSFRLADYLPESSKGPWATIIKPVLHRPSRQPPPGDPLHPCEASVVNQPSSVFYNGNLDQDDRKGTSTFSPDSGLNNQLTVLGSLPATRDSAPGILFQKKRCLKRLWRRAKVCILQYFATLRSPDHPSHAFSAKCADSKRVLPHR